MPVILHITQQSAWKSAQQSGWYRPDTIDTEGFIHCSTPEQVLGPANSKYRGQTDLVLLCINPDDVPAPIIYEDCYQCGQKFPHIYGPLNTGAVFKMVNFPPDRDGTFALPVEVSEMMNKDGQ